MRTTTTRNESTRIGTYFEGLLTSGSKWNTLFCRLATLTEQHLNAASRVSCAQRITSAKRRQQKHVAGQQRDAMSRQREFAVAALLTVAEAVAALAAAPLTVQRFLRKRISEPMWFTCVLVVVCVCVWFLLLNVFSSRRHTPSTATPAPAHWQGQANYSLYWQKSDVLTWTMRCVLLRPSPALFALRSFAFSSSQRADCALPPNSIIGHWRRADLGWLALC